MSEPRERATEPINPFVRRPFGVGLSYRERIGVLAIYAALYCGLGVFLAHHLVRSSGAAPPIAVAASSPSRSRSR